MEEKLKIKYHRKRKHYELDTELEHKMSKLTITKKLKTSANTFELISYDILNGYNQEDEQKYIEEYYKEKNKLLFEQMFGNNLNN
jgi:hypothetical protein